LAVNLKSHQQEFYWRFN